MIGETFLTTGHYTAQRGIAYAELPPPANSPASREGIQIERPGAIDRTLALCARLLASVEALAVQLDLPDLGDIELPPTVGSATDQAHLRTAAPLYLASELEEARLLPAVETLAGLFASGGLTSDPGAAAPLLENFWRTRRERFNASERRALLARVFGSSSGPLLAGAARSNDAFETLMIGLTESLSKLVDNPRTYALPAPEFQVRAAARQLAANLISRSGGVAMFAADELLKAVQAAIEILKQPSVQQAVRAGSVWGAVRNIAQLYLGEEVDIATHVTRGKAGMLVLTWLAEVLPQIDDNASRLVAVGHPVIDAALTWMQASLALAEGQPGQVEPRVQTAPAH